LGWIQRQYFKMNHDHFLPCVCQFVIYNQGTVSVHNYRTGYSIMKRAWAYELVRLFENRNFDWCCGTHGSSRNSPSFLYYLLHFLCICKFSLYNPFVLFWWCFSVITSQLAPWSYHPSSGVMLYVAMLLFLLPCWPSAEGRWVRCQWCMLTSLSKHLDWLHTPPTAPRLFLDNTACAAG
jgi:hypothetical protein